MPRQPVTVWYLEMGSETEFRPSPRDAGLDLHRLTAPAPEFARFLYTAVGWRWGWVDGFRWTREQWLARVEDPNREIWVAWDGGAPEGYFDLIRRADGGVEIDYFGLLPHALGRGRGGPLLNAAVRRAWAMGATRVYLNTCSLDHPRALHNYQARGFRLVREERQEREVPERVGDWPVDCADFTDG